MKNCIIASTSVIYGSDYLEYLIPAAKKLFKNVNEILFIPYAQPSGISMDRYTEIVGEAFKKLNKKIIGLHTQEDPVEAILKAKALFTGGGNTFVLVDFLYKNKVLEPLRTAIETGTPYLGSSAGSNICGLTMQTTNDMPISLPPSFKTLGIFPFNINPHYLDPDSDSMHKGETRETRIKEFHRHNSPPVVGLREGSWLRLAGDEIILRGGLNARVF